MAEPPLDYEPIVEVAEIVPVDSPKSLLKKDTEKFIEEGDDLAEPIDISVGVLPPAHQGVYPRW
jgi:hypothetical protein